MKAWLRRRVWFFVLVAVLAWLSRDGRWWAEKHDELYPAIDTLEYREVHP
jgi:hypothetical protein